MAAGTPVMKPFAFRFLEPAAARLFADLTGSSTTKGFLILGLISGWTLLYGVLRFCRGLGTRPLAAFSADTASLLGARLYELLPP